MQYLAALLISTASFIGLYNYLPLDLVTFNEGRPTFGATITTIAGTDTLSASRSVINTNFSNLNSAKFELSDWYATTSATQLTTLGTITTGTWNGTAIGVGYGGTGTTSPSLNRVLLGNGSSGVKIVSGPGSSGQVLMSNGEGSAPTWQSSSVNQTVPYTWTAHHIFPSLFSTIASTTHATTSSQYITGLTSELLKVDANGQVLEAVSGTDYAPPVLRATGVYSSTTVSTANPHTFTIAHGLGVTPTYVKVSGYCQRTAANADNADTLGAATSISSENSVYSTQGDTSVSIGTQTRIIHCEMTDGDRSYELSGLDATNMTFTSVGELGVAEMQFLWEAYR